MTREEIHVHAGRRDGVRPRRNMPNPEAHPGHHHHLAVGVAVQVGRVVGSQVELPVIDQDVEADRGPRPLPPPGLLIWSHGPVDDLGQERRRRAGPYLGAHEVIHHLRAPAGVVGRDGEVVGVGGIGQCGICDGEGDVRWGEANGDCSDNGDGN